MKLTPLKDKIVVKRLETEETTPGGLFIPDSAREKPQRGEILAVGAGTETVKMMVKPGDIVVFAKYAGDDFKLDGDELIIMSQDDLLAVVE